MSISAGQRSALLLIGGVGIAALCGAALYSQRRHYHFADKVVLITGGSRGLGLVLARRLLDENARVCICSRHPDDLKRAFLQSDHEDRLLTIQCDVSKEADVREMVRSIEAAWGPVDVLINNAGVIRIGPVETMTREDYRYMMDVHFWGALNTIDAVLPSMRKRGSGRIVNISSIGGLMPVPHMTAYCASKCALVGLSQSLRAELAKQGVVVTTVCPGLMRTGSHVRADFKGRNQLEYTWFSVAASMPVVAMSAERAAAKILQACRSGRAQLTLTPHARAAALANAFAPGLVSAALAQVNRALPDDGGIGTQVAKGYESTTRLSPSFLTRLGDRAAQRNNELPSDSLLLQE